MSDGHEHCANCQHFRKGYRPDHKISPIQLLVGAMICAAVSFGVGALSQRRNSQFEEMRSLAQEAIARSSEAIATAEIWETLYEKRTCQ